MTDPWCWYIYIYMLTWLGYMNGKCYHIWHTWILRVINVWWVWCVSLPMSHLFWSCFVWRGHTQSEFLHSIMVSLITILVKNSQQKSPPFPFNGSHIFPPFSWFFPYAVVYVLLIGGLEHEFYFSIYWECHHPNWRTPSFFRGVGIPPTSYWSTSKISNCSNRKGTYPTGLWKTILLLWYI